MPRKVSTRGATATEIRERIAALDTLLAYLAIGRLVQVHGRPYHARASRHRHRDLEVVDHLEGVAGPDRVVGDAPLIR